MRRNRLLLGTVLSVLLLVYPIISAKAAASMWGQTYDAFYNDVACSLVATSDGGYALAGSSGFFDVSDSDCWLVKTDTDGNMEWNKTYGASLDGDWAYSLIVTSDGGYALAGVQNCSASPLELHYWHYFYNDLGGDCWLVKTDANGNMEWNNTYGGGHPWWNDEAYSLVETSDGGYALAGSTQSPGTGSVNCWLLKTDGYGNIMWNHTYGGDLVDLAYSLIATSDGGYAAAGAWCIRMLESGHFDFLLIKTDENGVAPVAPEAAWVVLPFLLAATVSLFISKKKLLHSRVKEK